MRKAAGSLEPLRQPERLSHSMVISMPEVSHPVRHNGLESAPESKPSWNFRRVRRMELRQLMAVAIIQETSK
jgi:hypothetical protein